MKNLVSKLSLIIAFVITANINAQSGDIVKTASSVEDFSTLVKAVKAADLVKTLQSKGPFTVFAPVNDAFDKIPKKDLENLLKPENKAKLQNILTYHVVKGNLMAEDIVSSLKENGGKMSVMSVSGDKYTVMLKDGSVMIRDQKGNISKVVKTNVKASNGVIHVIDTVLMP